MNQLAGKVVAITGGGTGIGAGIAKSLAEAGCKVTVGGRRLEPLQALSDQVESEHPIRAQVIDVSEPDSVKSFFADIRVILAHQLAIAFFDVISTGATLQAQYFIIVFIH